jgi:fluoroacetyl-CoA thioesterase
MRIGDTATRSYTVTTADTARALGSGDLPVLGTPRLLAWCEAVTCVVLSEQAGAEGMADGRTSVGTRILLEHVAASPVGAVVDVGATVVHVAGRLVRLEVVAHQGRPGQADLLVAHGEVTRVLVDSARFMSRLGPPILEG